MCSYIWGYLLSLQLEINKKYFASILSPRLIEPQLKGIAITNIMVKLLCFIAMKKQEYVSFDSYVVSKHCFRDQRAQFFNMIAVSQMTVKISIFHWSLILLNSILKSIYSNFYILFPES